MILPDIRAMRTTGQTELQSFQRPLLHWENPTTRSFDLEPLAPGERTNADLQKKGHKGDFSPIHSSDNLLLHQLSTSSKDLA